MEVKHGIVQTIEQTNVDGMGMFVERLQKTLFKWSLKQRRMRRRPTPIWKSTIENVIESL